MILPETGGVVASIFIAAGFASIVVGFATGLSLLGKAGSLEELLKSVGRKVN